jgi:FLVCR family feline leukemia virus subgroup C receptor-related protein
MLYELLISCLVIPGFFLLRSNAKTPPSGLSNGNISIPMGGAIKALFKNRDFVLAFVSFSIYFGMIRGFNIVTPFMLRPFDYNSGEIAIQGSMPLVGGIMASFLIPSIV